jgi:hypothetical protein
MNDLLDRATRAARDVAPQHDRAAETRAKILAAGRRTTARRRRFATWLLPIAAAFVATGALAGGARWLAAPTVAPTQAVAPTPTVSAPAVPTARALPRANPETTKQDEPAPEATAKSPEIAPVIPAPPAPTPEAPRAPSMPSSPAAPLAQPPSAPTMKTPPPEPPPALAPPSPPAAPPPAAPAPPAATTPPEPTAADPAEELYRAAHEAHFRGGNPSAAIVAWDKYLAAAPNGRFAIEARFNRAMALLRAGRKEEGLSALEPFAKGAFGGYRQKEAQRLIEAGK